jgi:hypothetical protein
MHTDFISKEQYETIIEEVKKKPRRDYSLEMTICNIRGSASFSWMMMKDGQMDFRFITKDQGGVYYDQCCNTGRALFCYRFKTYEEFNLEFKKAIFKVPDQVCDYHTPHIFGTCPILLSGSNIVETCPICLDQSEVLKLEKTKCGHVYHLSCLETWAQNEQKETDQFVALVMNGSDIPHSNINLFYRCPVCRTHLHNWADD